MSRECVRRNLFAAAVVVLATAALALAAAPELAIDEQAGASGISWTPGFAFERAFLSVGGPTGVVLERRFDPGDVLSYDLTDENGLSLLDGEYDYGLLVVRSLSPAEASALEKAEAEAVRLREVADRLRERRLDSHASFGEPEAKSIDAASVDEVDVTAAESAAMAAEKRIDEVQAELEELNGPFVVRRSGRISMRDGAAVFDSAPRAPSQVEGAAEATESRSIPVLRDGPSAKLTEAATLPTIYFDDTQDEDCSFIWDWRILAEGGINDADTNNSFTVMGTDEADPGCGFDVQIMRLEHDGGTGSASSINSIVVESNGDIWMGDGTWIFDKSTDAISFGKGSIPSEDIEIWDSGPGVRLYDTTDGTFGTFYYNSPNLGLLGNTSQYIARIDATAPTNSIFMGPDGDVGLGGDPDLNNFFVELSVQGETPSLELATSGGTGWAAFERNSTDFITCISDAAETTWTCPSRIVQDTPYYLLNLTPDGVGIGTTSPTRKLHVVPDTPGQVVALFQNGTHEISRNDGGYSNIRFATAGGAVTQSWLFQNSPTNGEFVIRNETSSRNPLRVLRDAPNNSVVMRGAGVGILTNTPAGALDVNGSIYQRGGLIHADYVFEPEYYLPTIGEHARLMWSKSHLPAVPPRQVDEAGREVVDVGAQRRGILEELEVAHIYIEQLEKRMAQQEERLNQLEALLAEHE